tara:strand:- start:270 stop:434 length:165 start_codon:yes stop_codon:yes gene_type:complete
VYRRRNLLRDFLKGDLILAMKVADVALVVTRGIKVFDFVEFRLPSLRHLKNFNF